MSTDEVVAGILDRMDRQARLRRVALLGAVAVEALLLALVLLLTAGRARTTR